MKYQYLEEEWTKGYWNFMLYILDKYDLSKYDFWQCISLNPNVTYKIIKYTKADAVKLEGGKRIIEIIKYLRKNKINVMGHLGILPQSHKGKFRNKGKTSKERKNLLADALLLQKNGVFSIVLECIETSLAKEITKVLKIPTIGIGSSVNCDGQVLVTDDLIGLNLTSIKFVKSFYDIRKHIDSAVRKFKDEVKKRKYPSTKFSY